MAELSGYGLPHGARCVKVCSMNHRHPAPADVDIMGEVIYGCGIVPCAAQDSPIIRRGNPV